MPDMAASTVNMLPEGSWEPFRSPGEERISPGEFDGGLQWGRLVVRVEIFSEKVRVTWASVRESSCASRDWAVEARAYPKWYWMATLPLPVRHGEPAGAAQVDIGRARVSAAIRIRPRTSPPVPCRR